jgi:hypothetical protein
MDAEFLEAFLLIWHSFQAERQCIFCNLFNRLNVGSDLSGPIPSQLGKLSNLQLLYIPFSCSNLSENALEGEIPVELGYMPNLTKLYPCTIKIIIIEQTEIPSSLGGLFKLDQL